MSSRIRPRAVDVDAQDAGAMANERRHRGGADAAPATGDHGHLSRQAPVEILSSVWHGAQCRWRRRPVAQVMVNVNAWVAMCLVLPVPKVAVKVTEYVPAFLAFARPEMVAVPL